jgi:hypothetical protein
MDHPPGDHDHMQAGRLGSAQRLDRPRAEGCVLPDQRAVEVGRDDADVAREPLR